MKTSTIKNFQAVAFVLALSVCHSFAQTLDFTFTGHEKEQYPLAYLESQLFGVPDSPKSYSTYPTCDETIAVLSNGVQEKPWKMSDNFTGLHVNQSAIQMLVSLIPNRVIAVDNKEQSLTVMMQIMLTWTDCRLRYKPADYNYTVGSPIEVPQFAVMWEPELTIQENYESGIDFTEGAIVSTSSSGKVRLYLPQKVVKVSCSLDLAYYPFDTQRCSFTFRSTLYDTRYLSLIADPSMRERVDSEMINNFWQVRNLTSFVNEVADVPNTPPFSVIHVCLTIRRIPFFHLFNLVMPNTLLIFLCCAVFALPPGDAGTQMNMAVNIQLAIVVFMLVLYDTLPETGNQVALLSLYFGGCMGIVTLSCACAILTELIGSFVDVERVIKVPRCLHVAFFHYIGPALTPYTFKHLHKKWCDLTEEQKDSRLHECESSELTYQPKHENGATSVPQDDGEGHVSHSCCPYMDLPDFSQWKLLSQVFSRLLFAVFAASTTIFVIFFLTVGYIAYCYYD